VERDSFPDFSGYGIHAVDVGEITLTGRLTNPATPSGTPEMDNVVDGFFVQNASLNISDSWLQNTERGAIMEMSDNTEFKVNTSNITAAAACVFMNFNNNNIVEISQNNLTSGDPGQTQCSAIEILQMESGNQADQVISSNVIRTLGSTGESNGIRLVGVSNFTISDNDIMLDNLNSNAQSRNGVLTFSDNNNLLFSCNQVSSTSPETGAWLYEPVVGFYFKGLSNSTMSCNNFQQTKNGIRFGGEDDNGEDDNMIMANNKLMANSFNRHRDALRIGENALLGPQPYGGNTWSGEEEVGVRYDGGNADQEFFTDNRFIVNGSPNTSVWPGSILDDGDDDIFGWFVLGEQQNNSTCNFSNCTPDQQFNVPVSPCNEVALVYINQEFSFPSHPIEKERQFNRWLHDGLVSTTFEEGTNCNNQLEAYYNQSQTNSLSRLSNLQNVIRTSYESDNYTNGILTNLKGEANIFRGKIIICNEEISQSTSFADSLLWEAERLSNVIELGVRMGSIKHIKNTLRSYREERKDGLSSTIRRL